MESSRESSDVRSEVEATHGGHAAVDLPARVLSVELIEDPEALLGWIEPWRRLVQMSAEANVFFEPEVLVPAFEQLAGRGIAIALVTAAPRQDPEGQRVIAGLFPVELRRGHARSWLHRYSFTGTPLIRGDALLDTWSCFLDWALGEKGRGLVRLQKLVVDGPVFRALLEVILRRDGPSWVQDQHLRAEFQRAKSADAFLSDSMARKVRRNLRRQRRLLGEKGILSSSVKRIDVSEVETWCDAFLALEAKGWKGRQGTAMSSSAADARWFRAVAMRLSQAGRLLAGCLALDDQPIAMGAVFVSGADAEQGAYFKIAFDEAYSAESAGAVMQLDWIDALHGPDGLRCVDSCADPGHPMIDHVWAGRRLVQTLWLASGSKRSRVALAALPAAQLARSMGRGRR